MGKLAHIIMLSGSWNKPYKTEWYCNRCGRIWKELPDYSDPDRFTCEIKYEAESNKDGTAITIKPNIE